MNYKSLSKVIVIFLGLCLFLSGCIGVRDEGQSAVPVMTYDTVSAENIGLPCDSYYCDGKQYGEIVALFENEGFTNVKAIPQNGDATKETRINGSVIAVSVNNNIIFSQGALCSPDIEIRIYYVVSHISEVSQTISSQETVTSTTTTSSPESSATSGGETTNSTETAVTDSQTVWVTESGTKYHSKSTCSGMKDPTEITKREAEEQGYEPCKRCCK